MNIKASKGGKTAVFSEKVWSSGQPQRYGWFNADQDIPVKKLPAEILEFAEIRKKVKPPEVKQAEIKLPDFAKGGKIEGKEIVEVKTGEKVIPAKPTNPVKIKPTKKDVIPVAAKAKPKKGAKK